MFLISKKWIINTKQWEKWIYCFFENTDFWHENHDFVEKIFYRKIHLHKFLKTVWDAILIALSDEITFESF